VIMKMNLATSMRLNQQKTLQNHDRKRGSTLTKKTLTIWSLLRIGSSMTSRIAAFPLLADAWKWCFRMTLIEQQWQNNSLCLIVLLGSSKSSSSLNGWDLHQQTNRNSNITFPSFLMLQTQK
jgi:hypothetical protein